MPVIESPGTDELAAEVLAPSVRAVTVVLAVGGLVVLANPDNNPNPEAEVLVIGAEKPRESPGAAELVVGAAAPPNLVPPPRVNPPEEVVMGAAPRVRPELVPPSVNPVAADVVAAVAVPEPKANAGVPVVTAGTAVLFPPSVNPCDGTVPNVKPPA